MKLFGTIHMFNAEHGSGSIKPDSGGNDLSFDRYSFASWTTAKPRVDRRVSYEDGLTGQGVPCAMKLQVASRS
jgi:cold shock CspA family protein